MWACFCWCATSKAQVCRGYRPAVPRLVRRGPLLDRSLRTDSLLLVPSIGLRVSQLVAGVAVVGGVIAETLLTKKFRDKPLMVELPLNSENRARMKKLDGPTAFAGKDTALPASASRAEFVEKTAAWDETVKEALDRREHPKKNKKNPE
mgnify:CR=1 FL=1